MQIRKTKSCVKLSLSSEIIIKPVKSKVYLRFVSVLYLLSVLLLIYSSLYLVVKGILIFLILIQLRFDFIYQSPCSAIQEIRCSKKEWVLVMNNDMTIHYDEARILIHNPLFQLIELSFLKRKKLVLLFNDQLTITQLRLLHLKTLKK